MSFWVKRRKDNSRFHGESSSGGPSLRPPPPEMDAPASKDERDENGEEIRKTYPNQKPSARATIEDITKDFDLMDTEEEEWYKEMGQSNGGRIRVGTVSGAPPPPEFVAPASKVSFFRRFTTGAPPPKRVAKPIIENKDDVKASPATSPGVQNLTPGDVPHNYSETTDSLSTPAETNHTQKINPMEENTSTIGGGELPPDKQMFSPPQQPAFIHHDPLESKKSKKNLVRVGTDSVWEDNDLESLHTEMQREMIRLKSATNSSMVSNIEFDNKNDVEVEQGDFSLETPQAESIFTPEVDPNLGQPILTKKSSAFDGPKKGTILVENTPSVLTMSL